ncbi:MAG TPA: GNAT family N-acetyltransferase, partial [Thermoanaerobaculia bacterium]|nr:GNAT family N-acetyltransferase [Thermoanaerobaculia bacterium]
MTLSIRDAQDPAALEAFLGLPDEVYAGDPHYVPISRETVTAALRRPELEEAQRVLVAMEGGRPVARLAAWRSPALRDEAGRPYGMLGLFEALDRPEAAGRLFEEAIGWLRRTGAGPIVGPMDGDTWHRYRLNMGPWDDPPFLLEPYNPRYYPALWEGHGFEVLERYLSTRVDLGSALAHLVPRHREAIAAGYVLRRLDLSRFEDELRLLYRLSRVIFADNFLYTEIAEEDFLALYTGARRLLDPDLVQFAAAPDGQPVGFLFAYPDRFQAVAAMRGERGPLALVRYLRHRRTDTVDFKTLGVLPEHRRSGVAAALMGQGHLEALRKGYR